MQPSDINNFIKQVKFRSPADARKRLMGLAGNAGDTLALVRISEELIALLVNSPNPDAA